MSILTAAKERRAIRGNQTMLLFTKQGALELYEHGIAEGGRHGEYLAFADHEIDIRYESAGDLSSRITATRLLATGVFALALKKKKDTRTGFLTITVDGAPRWLHEISPDKAGKALRFATKAQAAIGAA